MYVSLVFAVSVGWDLGLPGASREPSCTCADVLDAFSSSSIFVVKNSEKHKEKNRKPVGTVIPVRLTDN